MAWWWILPLAAAAFAVRIVIHVGRTPSGVDTWYYLASADALRRRPGLHALLPQYLLQDERQSYPPLFPILLALLPKRWLDRRYWMVAPAIDVVHLLLLYVVTFRLTESVAVATLAAATYAFTPLLVSEARSLSSRPLGSLLHVLATLLMIKAAASGGAAWAAAVLAGALLFLSSAAMSAAYGFVCAVLSVAFGDPRYGATAAAAFLTAVVLSGGRMLRVVGNYVSAVGYWYRNHKRYGAHPVNDSPVYGHAPRPRAGRQPGFFGGSVPLQVLRLLGENPFLVALPFALPDPTPWGARLYIWSVAVAGLAVIAIVLPPLRAFGPGRSYMKAAIFPIAYTLAWSIGTPRGLLRPFGLLTLGCLALSLAAIAFHHVYQRRKVNELTTSIPPALAEAARILAGLPAGGVFVLPYMYADYICYRSGQPVLWGGHSGDLRRFEQVAPVITRPLPDLFRERSVRWVLLDTRFLRVEALRLDGLGERWQADGFVLFEWSESEAALQPAPCTQQAAG
jgi:hypothetical protein